MLGKDKNLIVNHLPFHNTLLVDCIHLHLHDKKLEVRIYTLGEILLPISALYFQFDTMNLYCKQ